MYYEENMQSKQWEDTRRFDRGIQLGQMMVNTADDAIFSILYRRLNSV